MDGCFLRWLKYGMFLVCIPVRCFAAPAQIQTQTQTHQRYTYTRVGKSAPVPIGYEFGIAMMGGDPDLDEAFRWLCSKAAGGELLVLRPGRRRLQLLHSRAVLVSTRPRPKRT
jgi:hypothetical protein